MRLRGQADRWSPLGSYSHWFSLLSPAGSDPEKRTTTGCGTDSTFFIPDSNANAFERTNLEGIKPRAVIGQDKFQSDTKMHWILAGSPTYLRQLAPLAQGIIPGASPLFAKPEMGSVRFRVHKMRRRPWPSAARVRPASVPARTPRGTRTPAMTGRRIAWPSLSSPPALTRRTPTKRSTLRLRGGRRTPLVAYAPSLSCAPPRIHHEYLFESRTFACSSQP